MVKFEYFSRMQRTTINTCLIIYSLTVFQEFGKLTEVSIHVYRSIYYFYIYEKYVINMLAYDNYTTKNDKQVHSFYVNSYILTICFAAI